MARALGFASNTKSGLAGDTVVESLGVSSRSSVGLGGTCVAQATATAPTDDNVAKKHACHKRIGSIMPRRSPALKAHFLVQGVVEASQRDYCGNLNR